MSRLSVIWTIVYFSFMPAIHAQNGFKVIKKAEAKFKRGNFKKALKLLSKAEDMNYGFCGNAWLDANHDINILRSKIYRQQGEYQLLRNSLDSIGFEYPNENYDSLRIRAYQLEFGKESFNKMMMAELDKARFESVIHDWYVVIALENGCDVRLKLKAKNHIRFILGKEPKVGIEFWLKEFKKSENFKLIQE